MFGIDLGWHASRIAAMGDRGPTIVGTADAGLTSLGVDDLREAALEPIIAQLADDASGRGAETSGPVAIAVPAWFHDGQRSAVVAAATGAGLSVLGLVNAPVAAVLGHWGEERPPHASVLVADIGRERIDLSVLEARDGSFSISSADGLDPLPQGNEAIIAAAKGPARRALGVAGVGERSVLLAVGDHPELDRISEALAPALGIPLAAASAPAEAVARGAAVFARQLADQPSPVRATTAGTQPRGGCLSAVIGAVLTITIAITGLSA